MLIKKTIECPNCKQFKSYLIEEKQSFVGITLKCSNCGKQHKCIKQKNHITKWVEVNG